MIVGATNFEEKASTTEAGAAEFEEKAATAEAGAGATTQLVRVLGESSNSRGRSNRA